MAPAINGNTTNLHRLRPLVVRSPQERRSLARLRRKTEKAVEQLLTLLDDLASDPDLEDGEDGADADDEPSLGWTASTRQQGPNWHGPGAIEIDIEQEHDGREPDNDSELGGDEEPSLGWEGVRVGRSIITGGAGCIAGQEQATDVGFDQTVLRGGGSEDLEDEHDGREDGGDDEPCLASPENHTPHQWLLGDGRAVWANQARWAQGSTDCREDDGDDREPDDLGGDARM